MTPPDGGEDTFNAWYDGHHTPSHVEGVPGFLSAMRYQSPAGPHYLAVYELDGVETLDSDEYRSRKYTPDDITRETLNNVSGFTRYIGNEGYFAVADDDIRTVLDAPVLWCQLFSVPMETRAAFDSWFDEEYAPLAIASDGFLGVRRYDIVDWDPEPHTHLILNYLESGDAMEASAFQNARSTERYRDLAGQPWFQPTSVLYCRRRTRFLKSGPAPE
jgi:hypothetical protein